MLKEKYLKNKILDLTIDIAFRRIFQDEKYKWYLSFLISYCTKIHIDKIYNHLVYKNNLITGDNIDKKTGEADILVEVDNMVINIEMNREVTETLIKKNKYYISSLDSRNTQATSNNKIKNKYIVQINVSTKARIPNTNTLLYEIVQMDRNLKIEDVYNNYIIYDLNLEYLEKELYNNNNKLTKEEKRLLIFIETNKEKLKEIFRGDKKMNETVDNLDMLKFYKADEEFYESYDHEEFERQVHKEALEEGLKEAREKGHAEGRTQGLAEGLAKGRSQGLAEGRSEGIIEGHSKGLNEGRIEGINQRNIEIVKNMLKDKIDIVTISKYTGLSPKEIQAIKEE